MNWPSPRKRQIDRDLQHLARLGALHSVQRPTVDGLAAAADMCARPARQPMDGTLVMFSIADWAEFEPGAEAGFLRALESILQLPERAR